MTWRVLVVDDEPLARRGVRAQLRREPDFAVEDECASGEEAIATLATAQPDLVFLDVEMPGLSGFDVVAKVGARMPPVIFLTAYAQYAVAAFDIDAVDYLLKPIDPARMTRALERARATLTARREDRPAIREPRPGPRRLERFWIRGRDGVLILAVDQVDWIAAEGDYVRIHSGGRSYLIPDSLTALEGRLPDAFVRIHRSTIVNHTRVMAVTPRGVDHAVQLQTGDELRVSRGYYRALVERTRA